MIKEKKPLKEAGVLFLAVLIIFSSSAAIASTVNTVKNINKPLVYQEIVWDNAVGVHGGDGGIFVATERPDGVAEPADDFKLDETKQVDSVFWQGGYFQCELAQGLKDYEWSWRVIFWDDHPDGWHPGNEIYNWTITNTSILVEPWYTWTNTSSGRQYWVGNYTVQLPETVTFEANKKYWITVRGIGAFPPQACWVRHNETVGGIKLHEAVFRGALWGFPDWKNLSELVTTEKIPHDFNFQLLYTSPPPPKEPKISCEGNLLWEKVKMGSTVNATFRVCNDGDEGSLLNWKVDTYPTWGNWTFTPSSGTDLAKGDCVTITVEVVAPAEKKKAFTGKIKMINSDNSSDFCEVDVSLTTPRARIGFNLLEWILQRYPNIFPILKHLI